VVVNAIYMLGKAKANRDSLEAGLKLVNLEAAPEEHHHLHALLCVLVYDHMISFT